MSCSQFVDAVSFTILLHDMILHVVFVINGVFPTSQLLGVSLTLNQTLMLILLLKLLRKEELVGLLVMTLRTLKVGILVQLQVWRQSVFSQRTLQNVSSLNLFTHYTKSNTLTYTLQLLTEFLYTILIVLFSLFLQW